jgi:hypothetical protein
MEDILQLLKSPIENSIDLVKENDSDIPIQDQFDAVFNKMQFVVGIGVFEMNSDYIIPDELSDKKFTLRHIAQKLSEMPIEEYDYTKYWQN